MTTTTPCWIDNETSSTDVPTSALPIQSTSFTIDAILGLSNINETNNNHFSKAAIFHAATQQTGNIGADATLSTFGHINKTDSKSDGSRDQRWPTSNDIENSDDVVSSFTGSKGKCRAVATRYISYLVAGASGVDRKSIN